MRIVFIHQNFPGQFGHLAAALQQRGHDVIALTVDTNQRPSPIPVARYKVKQKEFDKRVFQTAATFAERAHRGEAAARAAFSLRKRMSLVPDVIIGHPGWGETLFVKEVWPESRLLVYAEFFYRTRGLDVNFDPEFANDLLSSRMHVIAQQAHMLLAISNADKALAPTRWQAETFPEDLRNRITVIHDGIDTDRVRPRDTASVQLPGSRRILRKGDEVLTFVNRNLEPYRGYHIFMRALPKVLAARKEAQVVIVGGESLSYGTKPPAGTTWKQYFIDEVGKQLDLSRVHFVGRVPFETFATLMCVSRVHAYLTYPFVLSWSMLEAMSAGAVVVASRTPPVEEVIEDGVNGLLADFFDIEAWANTLIEALAKPQKFEALRHAARRTILEKYDLRRQCLPQLINFTERW